MPFILTRLNAKITKNITGPYGETGVFVYPGAPEVPFINFTFRQNVYKFAIDPGIVLSRVELTNLPLVPTTSLIPSALALSTNGEDWSPAEAYIGTPLPSNTLYVAELLFNYKYQITDPEEATYYLGTEVSQGTDILSIPNWELFFTEGSLGAYETEPVNHVFAIDFRNLFMQTPSSSFKALVVSLPCFIPHTFEITIQKSSICKGVLARYLAPSTFDPMAFVILWNLMAGASQEMTDGSHLLMRGASNLYNPQGSLLHLVASQVGDGNEENFLLSINYRVTKLLNPGSYTQVQTTPHTLMYL